MSDAPKAFILKDFTNGYPEMGRDYYVFLDKAELWRYVDLNNITKYEVFIAEMPTNKPVSHPFKPDPEIDQYLERMHVKTVGYERLLGGVE